MYRNIFEQQSAFKKLSLSEAIIQKNSKILIKKKNKTVFYNQRRQGTFLIPSWFVNKQKVDVSIIVPMFKSRDFIKEQIINWDFETSGHTSEVIYVDDDCPQDSYKTVLECWNAIGKKNIGNMIIRKSNGGYAVACNEGAKKANGDVLIFLNADCVVTKDWVGPLVSILKKHKDVGIVGNVQIKGDKIDSVGSKWNWKEKKFNHIRGLKREIDNFKTKQVEMVTGACFAIKNNIFYDLGGFDEKFKVGYWEDADLCMRVRSEGYKIICSTNSIVHHAVGHSSSVNHKYKSQNKSLFLKRWVETGRIDQFVKSERKEKTNCRIKKNVRGKVRGCMIVCNEEEFLEASADSISSLVNDWIIVVGGNEYAYRAGMCDHRGYPNDKTLEIAKKITNKYGGVVIEPPGRLWKDKVEMRNAYASKLKEGDWMFMLDGDEVYKENQLWKITELMKDYECLILQFWTFWNNVETIGTGVWDNYPQERVVKWHKGYGYSGKNHLFVSDSSGRMVKDLVPCYKGKERLFYHYSWVRPLDKIRQKLNYYKYQTGISRDSYIDDVFLQWRTKEVEGTHPFGGGGSEKFKGIHPESIRKLIEENKLNF
jgi:GT2 family glycosyltransferase